MPQPQQLRLFDLVSEEDVDLGLPSTDVDALLGLAEMVATGRPSIIVHKETVARLRKWADDED